MQDFLSKDYADNDIVWVQGHPVPPAMKIRPLRALRAAIALKNNKEDTSLVYEVTNALSGRAHIRKFKQFMETDYGRRVIETPIHIEELMCDRARLAAMPAGSVGRAFCDFMEGEQLSEKALLDATRQAGIDYIKPCRFEAFCRQVIHFKVTHDLWHILSGYGRDGLGEICLLKFYNGQWYDRGIELIIKIGGYSMGRQVKGLPVQSAIKEASENSKAAKWIMGVDIESYIELPIAEAREMLGIHDPKIYQSVTREIKQALLPPKQMAAAE